MDIQTTASALTDTVTFLRGIIPPSRFTDGLNGALIAIPAGFLLAFWGARLLRTIYVLAFMVVGGAIGIRLAGVSQVDSMIGLVVGAGIAGLLAHLLFRWWVAVSTGLLAILILGALTSPEVLKLRDEYNDYRLGVGTRQLTLQPAEAAAAQPAEMALEYVTGFWKYVQEKQPQLIYRTGALVALLWILAVLFAMLMPRLVMVLGTSIFGVGLLAGGVAAYVQAKRPDAWSYMLANGRWCLGALGVLLLAAISYQARGRRPVAPPAKEPAPEAA